MTIVHLHCLDRAIQHTHSQDTVLLLVLKQILQHAACLIIRTCTHARTHARTHTHSTSHHSHTCTHAPRPHARTHAQHAARLIIRTYSRQYNNLAIKALCCVWVRDMEPCYKSNTLYSVCCKMCRQWEPAFGEHHRSLTQLKSHRKPGESQVVPPGCVYLRVDMHDICDM